MVYILSFLFCTHFIGISVNPGELESRREGRKPVISPYGVSNRSVGYLNCLLCLLFVSFPCLYVYLHLHGGSPKPGTDSNEIHAKQVILDYFGHFPKLLVGPP